MKKLEILLLSLILIGASFVRLYRIDLKMRFLWDEGRDMLAVRNILVNRDLTLFGPYNEIGDSKDFFGVFHYYFMAPSLWLTGYSPIGPAIFTALLGVVSVLLLFILLRKWRAPPATIWASVIIYAFSPLVIKYVQWPWNPNTTAFFCLLYFLVLTAYYRKSTVLRVLATGLLLGIMFQLHYFTVSTVAAFFIVLVFSIASVKHKLRDLVLFAAGFLLPNLSFVVFDITHEGFYSQILIDAISGDDSQRFLFSGVNYLLTAPLHVYQVVNQLFNTDHLTSVLLGAMLMVMVIFQLVKFWKNKRITLGLLVSASLLLFLLIISIFPKLPDVYHSSFLWWGVIFIFVNEVITVAKKYKVNKNFLRISILLLAAWLIFSVNLNREPSNDENMPLIKYVGEQIAEDAILNKHNSINVVSLVDNNARAVRFRYFIVNKGIVPEGIDQYPNSDVLYVVSNNDWRESLNNPAWELDSVRQIEGEKIAEREGYVLFKASKLEGS